MIQDSGERRQFKTGAVRDIQVGKGRCDLLPLREVAELMGSAFGEDQVLMDIDFFMQTKDTDFLIQAIRDFAAAAGKIYRDKVIPTAILEVSKLYEEGAQKYAERNWEKGIPLHSFIDSGIRHYLKFRRGDDDERHDRAFIWNMLGAVWTLRNRPECDDLFRGSEDILPKGTEGETSESTGRYAYNFVRTSKDCRTCPLVTCANRDDTPSPKRAGIDYRKYD